MDRTSRLTVPWAALALAFSFIFSVAAPAQTRLSDKDLERRIKNLNSDSKKFQSSFNNAISKSSIRKTSQEKDAKKLADNFTKSTKSLYDYFKRTRKSDPYIQNTLDYAKQLEKLQSSVQLDSTTNEAWTKVRTQLNDIAHAFHVPAE
jgi:uncharacterized membrane protein YgaE (UPF0421/DUF939 family)